MSHEVTLSTGRKAIVTNIMADGTECDDLTGYVIPYNEHTAIAYDIWIKAQLEKRIRESNPEGV